MDKDLVYQTLNSVLESMESRNYRDAQTQLEGFINEIKYGVYDN